MSGSSLTREGTQMTKFIEFKKRKGRSCPTFCFFFIFCHLPALCPTTNWSFWWLKLLVFGISAQQLQSCFTCKSNILVRLFHEYNQRTAFSVWKVFGFLTITQHVPRFLLWGNEEMALGLGNISGNGDRRNGKIMQRTECHWVASVSPEKVWSSH